MGGFWVGQRVLASVDNFRNLDFFAENCENILVQFGGTTQPILTKIFKSLLYGEKGHMWGKNELVDNFENSEIEDWEGFIQKNYGEKNCQNQPQSKEVSAIEPAKKRMKMTYDSNLDYISTVFHTKQVNASDVIDVVKKLQQTDKAKKPKKSDKTDAKYVCEECQKEGCRLYCIRICYKNILRSLRSP